MTTEAADEAQALLRPPVRMETGHIRNGQVEHAEVIEIPDEFFQTILSTVLEQLRIARDSTLYDYPSIAANSVATRLVDDGVVDRQYATKVRDLVELEIKRGIKHLSTDAHDRFIARLPITLRLLIPLISKRSGIK